VAVAWPFGQRQISTPLQLFVLCAAVLLPSLAFSGWLVWRYSASERELIYGKALDSARQISTGLDRDLNGRIGALRVLALSRALASGDYDGFRVVAQRASQILGSDVVFKSPDGQMLVDSSEGTPSPVREPLVSWEQQAVVTSGPVVSDLIEETSPYLLVSVPVRNGDVVSGVLSMRVPTAQLSEQLAQAGLPVEWTASIVDGAGRILARSHAVERFFGALASEDLRRNATGREGAWFGTTLEGHPVFSAYAASGLSNWRIAVGAPVGVLSGPLNTTLLSLLVMGALGLLISGCVAVFFGGAISSSMAALARQAANPDSAGEATWLKTPLREVNTVSAALAAGADKLRRRAAERDEALQALEASRNRLERLLKTAPIGILEVTPTEISFANDTALKLLRLQLMPDGTYTVPARELESTQGQPLGDAENPVRRALNGEVVTGQEIVQIDPETGVRTVVTVNATPILINDRLEGALASFVDITERYQAEQALRNETRRLETLNETGMAIAAQLDLESLMQSVTSAGVRLLGAQFGGFVYSSSNEESGGEATTLQTLSGIGPEAFHELSIALHSTKPVEEHVLRVDNLQVDPGFVGAGSAEKATDSALPTQTCLTLPVRSRAGEIMGRLLFGHQEPGVFTEQHERLLVGIAAQAAIAMDNARLYETAQRAEAALRGFNQRLEEEISARTRELSNTNAQLKAEIEQRHTIEDQLRQAQKMEAVGQLTGGLAHDFNNLLAIVLGSLDVLSRRLEKGRYEDTARFISAATDGATRAAALTQRLLTFARRQPLAPVVLDANQLVTGMSELLSGSLNDSISIETELSPGLWHTHADRNQLENALLNLTVNARDAMPHGGKLVIATTNAVLDRAYAAEHLGVVAGEYVMIQVTDTGTGMPPDVISRAFDPFFTTKETGKGTGLGLSQIYGFVQGTGGHILIDSTVGVGTAIRMYLPRFIAGQDKADQAVLTLNENHI